MSRGSSLRTFANCVAVFFILHFFWSYYRNCYRKGYRIDVWHFTLVQMLFVTSIMLPFNRSRLNVISFSAPVLTHALPYVDQAFLISALGYGCTILGGSLWRLRLGLGLRATYSDLLNQPARIVLVMLRSPRLLFLAGGFALLVMSAVLAFYFSIQGFGLSLGTLFKAHPEIRPVAQFAGFLGVSIGSFALGRFEVRRERSMLLLSALLGAALFFYGGRSFLLGVAEAPLLVWMMRLRTRLKLVYLGAIVVGAFASSILLDALRHQDFAIGKVLLNAGISIAFGNTFSDTRDFAVVLSYWDHTFFLGKTYLAGLIAFIPRVISPFRDKWAFGVVTATIAGLNPREHAGLRIGNAGEAYLNFGLPAVILVGLFGGSIVRFIDMRVKESIDRAPNDVRAYSYFFLGSFSAVVVNSVGFSDLYTTLELLLLSIFILALSRFIKLPLG